MKIHRITAYAITAVLTLAWVQGAPADTPYDIVILDGRVMDPETRLDAIRNVGVRDGVIEIITREPIAGLKTINARGLVVAPGFIDAHFHGQDPFAVKMALRDGVTTALDLEAGAGNIGQWYAEKQDSWQVNYGMTVSHSMVRMSVHDPEVGVSGPADITVAPPYLKQAAADGVPGWSVTRSNTAQVNEISALIDEGLRQGALGVGSGLAYMATGVSSYEMFEVQRAAARYGRVTAVHTRFHLEADTPTEAPIAFDEVFSNAALLGAPLLIAHNNDYGWEEIEEKLQLARAQGLNMWSEHYPYAAASTIISARFLQPSIWQDKYGYRYEETLYAPQSNRFLDKASYEEIVQSDPGQAIVAFIPAREKWLPHWLAVPHMTVASDGMAGGGVDGKLLPWDADYSQFAGHPRTAGSYAKTLKLARERGVPLMHTLAQTSYWSAKHLGDTGLMSMQKRGRLQEGMIADIAIFDAGQVTDNADYQAGSNGLPSTGIPWVIVNGRIVVSDSRVQKEAKPGQPIRYPVEKTGRHEAISAEKWVRDFTIYQPAPEEKITGLSHLP